MFKNSEMFFCMSGCLSMLKTVTSAKSASLEPYAVRYINVQIQIHTIQCNNC